MNSTCANGRGRAPSPSNFEPPIRTEETRHGPRSSFPTTTPTTTATRSRSAGCSPSSGGELSLAYVRHTQQPDSAREALEEKEAEELLAQRRRGARRRQKIPRHVVVHASTSAGLWELAEQEKADVIVFGSDYRTAAGRRHARHLGPADADRRPRAPSPSRPPASATTPVRDQQHRRPRRGGRRRRRLETAKSLADALGATVAEPARGQPTCSSSAPRPASPKGHVNLSARAGYAIETANSR